MRAKPLTFRRAQKLRREMTLPEIILWDALRGARFEGLRFRRQHPVGTYIVDFYCPAAKVAIEVDGSVHDIAEQAAHDRRRHAWLADRGIRVLRFQAIDILNDRSREDVLATIASQLAPSVGFADSSPVNGGAPTNATSAYTPPEAQSAAASRSSLVKRGRPAMRNMVKGASSAPARSHRSESP